ncbi:hydantoinase/oxoprolinase family protein [Streptosporangium sp. KLBMP 9127]|nr:hydantoinase/oxoprolinase family protein [Streptosporangium sp. KLBMP 9127]
MTVKIGIDVGGTFTDLVAALPDRGQVLHHKEPSTPGDPSLAVVTGMATLLSRADLGADQVTGVTHGTTIGLNAIIQRRGARIALIVTEGYRDVLEIGRSRMPSSFDLYAGKEEPLVPRERIVEIAARLAPGGAPATVPDEGELDRVAARVAASGADAAALIVLHGYADPSFEEGIAERLRDRLPGLPLMAAATIWPEVREYERALVACLNAYIQPLMREYFARLESGLTGLGVTAPIFISASNGGSLSLRSAAERPIETVLSGPASGVTAAVRLATAAGVGNIVTFDMGGTSSDIAVTVGGSPEFATHTTVGGLPLIVPVIAVNAIGAGGGSVIWADEHGVLKAGPDSAGADPGPVAYGRGGTRPTVTDCYLVTGVIDPATFLGGRMPLDAAASAKALDDLSTTLAVPRTQDDGPARAHADSPTRASVPHRIDDGTPGAPSEQGGTPARASVTRDTLAHAGRRTDSEPPAHRTLDNTPDGALEGAHAVAAGALRVATAGMATELQKIMAQRGLDPREFTLVPFGGAGPTHAALLAAEVGIGHIVVPPDAATFCALGAAGADLRRDLARSLRRRLDDAGAVRLREVLSGLATEARTWLTAQNRDGGPTEEPAAETGTVTLSCSADMRYSGQAYELRVALPSEWLDGGDGLDAAVIAEAFHTEHERLYGFRDATAPIELGTARLAVTGAAGPMPAVAVPPGAGAPRPGRRRDILLGDTWHTADVHSRVLLGAGDAFDGPAIVEQDDTTVLVPPGWSVSVDAAGNLHLHLRGRN